MPPAPVNQSRLLAEAKTRLKEFKGHLPQWLWSLKFTKVFMAYLLLVSSHFQTLPQWSDKGTFYKSKKEISYLIFSNFISVTMRSAVLLSGIIPCCAYSACAMLHANGSWFMCWRVLVCFNLMRWPHACKSTCVLLLLIQ